MSYSFKRSFEALLEIEGFKSDHPDDRGGSTKYGISTAFLNSIRFKKKVDSLTKADAEMLYKKHFWDKMNCSKIAMYSEPLAYEVFEFGVHAGVGVAAKKFQQLLNILNRNEQDYPDIAEDGVIGEETLKAYDNFIKSRPKSIDFLIGAYNVYHGAYLIDITSSEKGRRNEQFFYGWFKNRVLNDNPFLKTR